MKQFPIEWCREQFPALQMRLGNHPVIFFDGPGGSQVPQSVVDAIGEYLIRTNANVGGLYETSRASDELLASAHQAVADFIGTAFPEGVVFGANMTTLTFALSRALARRWTANDQVIVTQLDHDGNVTPWILAARDAGATVIRIPFRQSDCTLDIDELRNRLSSKTKLVAIGCASNLVGTINPVQEICRLAHDVGAQVFLDCVHYAPHQLPSVDEWDCDWLACSAYKFFGPHVGVLWGRPHFLRELQPYKLRPVTENLPGRWMTGTQNHEGIAGTKAAIEYLTSLGRQIEPPDNDRRSLLQAAYGAIVDYEQLLVLELLKGLQSISDIRVLGITEPSRVSQRTPTVSFLHARRSPADVAEVLGRSGLFVGNGNFYALSLTESLGLEPNGVVRLGLMHYNTFEEIERLIETLKRL